MATGEGVAMGIFIRHTMENLQSWMAPNKVGTPLEFWLGKSEWRYEPLGLILVIATWNYPFVILLDGLISAIAAGNVVMIKPTDLNPEAEKIFMELLPKYLDQEAIGVAIGGPDETQHMLNRCHFDHILYTGK